MRRLLFGLRAIKAAVEEYGGVNEVPTLLDFLKVSYNSCRMCVKHLRQENVKKIQKEAKESKQEARKRKCDEIRAEEKSLHEKTTATKGCTNSSTEGYRESYQLCGRRKTENKQWTCIKDMMEVQAGNKLIEIGRQQQSEGNKKQSEISGEREKNEIQLFKISKNLNLKWKCSSET